MNYITVLALWTLSVIAFIGNNVTEPPHSGVRISMILKFKIIVVQFGIQIRVQYN